MRKLSLLVIVFSCLLAGAAVGGVRWLQQGLPPVSRLQRIEPSIKTLFFSAAGDTLAEFYEENRVLVPIERIPSIMVDALLATEDRAFYDHWGVNPTAVLRALIKNVQAGRVVQGGSTITQQLSRELFLTKDQTYLRKALEAMVALEIEKTYTKDEILEMYLNQIYFGQRAYGIQAAAQTYFSLQVEELGLRECALLAGIPKSPRDYNPVDFPDRALDRRNTVIYAMLDNGNITKEVADSVAALDLGLGDGSKREFLAPYFVEYVRQILVEQFPEDEFRSQGLHVYTTLDLEAQRVAEEAIDKQMADLEKRWFLRDNTREKYLALPEEEHPAVPPYLQAAFVALEPATGHVQAMVGGRNYWESNFNRAVQAKRQPGSAFKPILFAAAITDGFRPSDTIQDTPVVLTNGDGTEWRPQNYDRKFHGTVTLREALAKSINLPAIKLVMKIGPQAAVEEARRFGIQSPMAAVPSLALGVSEVSLIEITKAYSVLRNAGLVVEPNPILRIEDRNGHVLFESETRAAEGIPVSIAYVMTDMMESVCNPSDGGTGSKLRRNNWNAPAAGKTGTTDEYTDAWFIGFTNETIAGAWVGFDEKRSMGPGMTGAEAALPFWIDYVKAIGDSTKTGPFYPRPLGVTERRICRETGFLASAHCPGKRDEVYLDGSAPQTRCFTHQSPEAGGTPIDFGGAASTIDFGGF